MSYDIWLEIDTGGKEKAEVAEVGNYTSNVGNMWYKALGCSLSELNGKVASKCILKLKKAIKNMEENPNVYKKMNPPNGWGSYEGALKFLIKLLDACEENPKATITMWY